MLPSRLHRILSDTLAVPLASVEHHARGLRQAGLIPVHGRGTNASRMGPREAATLLVAVVGSASPSEAPGKVAEYAGLVPAPSAGGKVLAPAGVGGGTFVDALASLVESVRTGLLADVYMRAGMDPSDLAGPLSLEFRLSRPSHARIVCRTTEAEERLSYVPATLSYRPERGIRSFNAVSGEAVVSLGLSLRA